MGALHFVIPNLFRDLGFGEAVVGGIGLVVGKSKGSVARCKFQVVSKKAQQNGP